MFTCHKKILIFSKNLLLTVTCNLHTINLVTRNLPVDFYF